MTQRIVIAGGPRCGKTTHAARLHNQTGATVHHTDDLIGRCDWSAASLEVSTWFNRPAPWIVEGVAAARALRKWLASHPAGKPCDVVVLMRTPFERLTGPQEAMRKGCDKVWSEVAVKLVARGVEIRPALIGL